MNENHDHIKDLVAAYVLGSLPHQEHRVVRDHILACDECLAEADDLSKVAGRLALAVDEEHLPAGFADRVVAAVAGGEVTSPRPRWRPSAVAVLAGLAAILFVGVLGVSTIRTQNRLELNERVLSALLRDDEGLALRGPSGATAQMVPTNDGGYFVAAGLHDAPRNHTYQLWLIRGEQPESAGTFAADDGIAILELEASLDGVDAVAVTVEPAGGSPGPTTDPILISNG